MADSILPPENLFAVLPAELSRGLFEKAPITRLVADQMLFLAGDAGDACYRVEEGLLKASVFAPGGDERILAIFGPGSLVGELSMIDGRVRSASVAALRPSKLSLVSRAAFDARRQLGARALQRLVLVSNDHVDLGALRAQGVRQGVARR